MIPLLKYTDYHDVMCCEVFIKYHLKIVYLFIYDKPRTITVINVFTKCNHLLSLLTLSVISILASLEINSWAIPLYPFLQASCRAVCPHC